MRAFAPIQSKDIQFLKELDKHHFARLSMMMAEERNEKLSYEDALKNEEVKEPSYFEFCELREIDYAFIKKFTKKSKS